MDFYTTAFIQGLGYAALGLGIFISLKIFNIPDITTDGSFTLGGVVSAVFLFDGYSPVVAFAGAVFAGALAGVATGLIHTRLKVNALLSGILVMTALYSVNLSIMGRSNLPLLQVRNMFREINMVFNPVLNTMMVMGMVVFFLFFFLNWLLRTDYGIAMRATGNSEQMVTSAGVNISAMKVAGLALANSLTAISGFLLIQYQGFADINMGIGIVISGLAAVIIGETFIGLFKTRKIAFQIIWVIGGSILFRLILAFALDSGLNPNYLKLVTAVIVLLVVAIGSFNKRST